MHLLREEQSEDSTQNLRSPPISRLRESQKYLLARLPRPSRVLGFVSAQAERELPYPPHTLLCTDLRFQVSRPVFSVEGSNSTELRPGHRQAYAKPSKGAQQRAN